MAPFGHRVFLHVSQQTLDSSFSSVLFAKKELDPPRLNRNQFRANFGGPVWLPKIYNGREKTFFFFNWESGRLLQANPSTLVLIPPSEIRTGDFRNLVNSRTNAPIVLRDPLNVGIRDNVIPFRAQSPGAGIS